MITCIDFICFVYSLLSLFFRCRCPAHSTSGDMVKRLNSNLKTEQQKEYAFEVKNNLSFTPL